MLANYSQMLQEKMVICTVCENTDMRHLRTRLHVSSLVSDAAHYPEGEDSP